MDENAYKDWRRLDETKEFFAYLEKRALDDMTAWGSGQFTTESSDGTIQRNAEAIGRVQFIGDIITLEAEDVSIA